MGDSSHEISICAPTRPAHPMWPGAQLRSSLLVCGRSLRFSDTGICARVQNRMRPRKPSTNHREKAAKRTTWYNCQEETTHIHFDARSPTQNHKYTNTELREIPK